MVPIFQVESESFLFEKNQIKFSLLERNRIEILRKLKNMGSFPYTEATNIKKKYKITLKISSQSFQKSSFQLTKFSKHVMFQVM
jgi:hypothetical protein